jgi:uncharacterized protein with PIN domain
MNQVELIHSELVEMIKSPDYYGAEETLNHFNQLLKETYKDSSKIPSIIEDYSQEKLEEGKCPECTEYLENIPHKQHSECRGTDAIEFTYTRKCPNCGWDEDRG